MLNNRNFIRTIKFFFFFLILILILYSCINSLNFNNISRNEEVLNQEKPLTSQSTNYFAYYKEITIDHNKVSGTQNLVNFSILFSIFDTDLHDKTQSDGDDIAFFDGSEWLNYEIELYIRDFNATHAQLIAWVQIPSLSPSVDTSFYMYFGNFTMNSQENPSGTWESNYKGLWHLNTTLLDSTANNNDGINYQANDCSAFIARGRDYDGVDDYSNMYSGSSIDNVFNGGATISTWIYPEGWGGGGYGRILDKSTSTGGSDGWVMCLDGVVNVPYQLLFYRDFSANRGLWYTGQDTISLNQWQYVVVCYDDSSPSNDPTIFINGVSQTITEDVGATPSGIATNDASQDLYIGNFEGGTEAGSRGFDGLIDEVRISSGIKSSGWIQTEYNNQLDPNSFYSISSTVVIDNIPPKITINSPINYAMFGNIAPNFNVEIKDNSTIDSRWYRLSNETITTTNTTFVTNGTISQTQWDKLGNGTVSIQFFANDSLGNIGFSEVIVRKDIKFPSIIIDNPSPNELFGEISPNFNVVFSDSNGIDTQWYTIDGGITNYTFFGSTGTIDQTAWEGQGNGTVTIRFYGNDSLGNIAWKDVIVRKDIVNPEITITSPTPYELFGSTPPPITINIAEPNHNTTWYQLDNGTITTDNYSWTGVIEQNVWDQIGNGTVTIQFFANDSVGNLGFTEVNVRKDIVNPEIIITSPTPYELFGSTPPPITLDIAEPNHATTWYQLDNGTITTENYSWTGVIEQNVWDQIGNGTVTIRFYTNDSTGNIAWEEVTVRKDIEQPSIVINSPNDLDLFGYASPPYNVEIWDINGIDSIWYTLNDGVKTFFTTNGTISQIVWDSYGSGDIAVKFYANDSVGNEAFSSVVVEKDVNVPIVVINNPDLGDLFGHNPPNFNVRITDQNGISDMWYTLNDGVKTFFTTNGTISQIVWDSYGSGDIAVRIYANDSVGNEAFSSVVVEKDIDDPIIMINFPNPYGLFGDNAPSFNVYINDSNIINMRWYTIDGGETNISFTSNGTINQFLWNSRGNGTVIIQFFATDSLGNVGTSQVIVRKDIEQPSIVINSPIENEFFKTTSPEFDITTSDPGGIDTQWYTIDGGITNFIFAGSIGSINQTAWNGQPDGNVTIRFYANDTMGNIAWQELTVRKDIILPLIEIDNPSPDGAQTGGSVISISGIANGTGSNILSIYINDTRWGDGFLKPQTDPSGSQSGSFIFTNNTYIAPGFYWIKINITDTAGNNISTIRFFEIIVEDISPPLLTITSISPNPSNGYTEITVISNENLKFNPMLNITLPNNSIIYRPMNLIGSLTWRTNYTVDANGEYIININGTDPFDNVGYTSDTFIGDITPPSITIYNPDINDLFGENSPNFNVEITDFNGVDTMWYTLNDGVKIFFTTNGTISQIVWDSYGSGSISIKFYANDSLGNEIFSEVIVQKDIDDPFITINSPNSYQLFGIDPPSFNIRITDESPILLKWYSIDGGLTNITFSSNTSISKTLWDLQDNGNMTITFFARDSLGNEGSSSVIVQKNIEPPSIIINNPNPSINPFFGENSPNFNVEITDFNGVDTMWYSLDGGLTNTIFTTNNSINQAIWDTLEDGNIIITFYANNTIGTTGFSEVTIIKDLYAPSIIINDPINNSYWNHAPTLNISSYDVTFENLWITIGNNNISLISDANFQLNDSIWNNLSQGSFQILLNANDALGHLNTEILTLYKDTICPDAPTLLTFPQGEVSYPITFDWEDETDMSGIAYYRLVIDNKADSFTTSGSILEVNITNKGSASSYYELTQFLSPGKYYYSIYAVDTAGNIGNPTSGTFTIINSSTSPEFPWWIIIIIIGVVGAISVLVIVKKMKSKTPPSSELKSMNPEKMHKLKEKREKLDKEAKIAFKEGNYETSANLYEECKQISNQLFQNGYKIEARFYKDYRNLEAESRSKIKGLELTNSIINALLTNYFNEFEMKYYTSPEIYPENQNTIDGLILNENKFLQRRLQSEDSGKELIRELNLDPTEIEHIKAIQFIYTSKLSEDTIIKYCEQFQHPEMLLFIVGIDWPAYQYEETMIIPRTKSIKYSQNIRIVKHNLFADFIGVNEKYTEKLNKIIESKYDLDKLHGMTKVLKTQIHDTIELKEDLKQKKWFLLI
ncbi:MAG: LamG domain-containing protein [Candidatus Lokiarchaeota archaeon]